MGTVDMYQAVARKARSRSPSVPQRKRVRVASWEGFCRRTAPKVGGFARDSATLCVAALAKRGFGVEFCVGKPGTDAAIFSESGDSERTGSGRGGVGTGEVGGGWGAAVRVGKPAKDSEIGRASCRER